MTPPRLAQRLRRALFRRGLTLEVSRVRDPAAIDYHQCIVRNPDGKIVRAGTIEEVERWLARTSPAGRAYTRAVA